MEVRINKEVRNYQESLFFGLNLRQFIFALLAVAVAVGVYFALRTVLGTGEIGWVCVLAALSGFPIQRPDGQVRGDRLENGNWRHSLSPQASKAFGRNRQVSKSCACL